MQTTRLWCCSGALKGFFTLMLLVFFLGKAWAQLDLPFPPSNMETLPAGSLLVPMDNKYQSTVPAGQAPFNLKVYGLINQFLQNGIPVKWVIRSGKQKGDADLSAMAERFAPGFVASNLLDFTSGPFVVPDTVLPCGLSTREIIRAFGGNVAVYKLMASVTADVRYTLIHRPKIAVFNNGGNQLIHTKILDAAGITHYDVMDAANIANLINCYTFVSEPHADDEEISLPVISAIKKYVANGGNFLAQCHAIAPYENKALFMTTAGIQVVNEKVVHRYPNADLAFSQIDGALQENEGGSIHNWTLNTGSAWLPTTYRAVSHTDDDTVVAMGAHVIAPNAPGGNVFYLGGHDYSKGGANKLDFSTLARVNALRMYLNGIFIPSRNSNGAWANAGIDTTITCDSAVLGCNPTGPEGSSFSWTPAAGLSCTSCPNPIAKPTVTTLYQVEVRNGCVAKDVVKVTVVPKPTAQFTSTKVCQGESTQLTDQSANATFWRWDFGDVQSGVANLSSEQHPTHTFSTAGQFVVTLVSGASSACSDTSQQTVTVKPLPVLTLASPTICEGQSALLAPLGAVSYKWSSGSTQKSLTVAPNKTTAYTVTGTDSAGCKASTIATVTVASKPIATIVPTPVRCFGHADGASEAAIAGGTPDFQYTWNTQPVQTTARATGLKKGSYTVQVKDANGCMDTATGTVQEPLPLVANVVGSPVKCFGGNDGTVEASVSGGTHPYSYQWNPTVLPATAKGTNLPKGIYTVTVTDSNGCQTIGTDTIQAPTMTTSLQVKTLPTTCHGGQDGKASVVVKGPTPPYRIQWDTDPVQTTDTAFGLKAGTYTVTVRDSYDCPMEASGDVSEPPPFAIALGPDQKLCPETDAPIVLRASDGVSFFWHPTGDTARSITVKSAGTHRVTAKNKAGCEASAATKVVEVCPPRLFVSNSFTPNGDGINDLYAIYGEYFSNFHMFIFNRWGEIIFESKDKYKVWDGNYREEPMPIGVYPWLITYTGDSEEYYGPYRLKGSVTVVR